MKLSRGDVVMTRFPHASGARGKKRPALVVQANSYNAQLGHVIIAEITTNKTSLISCKNLRGSFNFAIVRPSRLAGERRRYPPAQKAWQTGKLNFFSDATTIVVHAYGAN